MTCRRKTRGLLGVSHVGRRKTRRARRDYRLRRAETPTIFSKKLFDGAN
jgi:hypothetical protein